MRCPVLRVVTRLRASRLSFSSGIGALCDGFVEYDGCAYGCVEGCDWSGHRDSNGDVALLACVARDAALFGAYDDGGWLCEVGDAVAGVGIGI